MNIGTFVATQQSQFPAIVSHILSGEPLLTLALTLRHHQNQAEDHIQQPNQTNQLNIALYRKAVSTALWLQFMLVVCYLPYLILVTLSIHAEPSSSVSLAWSYCSTLVYLNSSLSPILYCWKIAEVRQAVKETIREVLCY